MRYLPLASLILIAASPFVSAQSAYFSLEGTIPNVTSAAVDFHFDLSRSVSDPELFRFETDSWLGGLNAAGDVIPASGFDSVLKLFDGGGTPLAEANEIDNGGSGHGDFDALLSWAGVQGRFGTPIPSPRPAGDYRLRLSEFGSGFETDWANELRGPADAMTFTGATGVNGGTVTSLKFGAGAGGTATYRLDADLTDLGTLVAQSGGLLLGNGADASSEDGEEARGGQPGRRLVFSDLLGVDVDAAVSLRGGASIDVAEARNAGSGGALEITGGSATLAGTVTIDGGTGHDGFVGGTGGSGGSLGVVAGSMVVSGAVTLDGGAGGAGNGAFDGGNGGTGGSLTVSGGSLAVSGAMALNGGLGRTVFDSFPGATGGVGGGGGSVEIVDGLVTVTGSLDQNGGDGGNTGGGAGVRGGGGGHAGGLSISGGDVTVSGTWNLNGGQAGATGVGAGADGGIGGDGGAVGLTGGSVSLTGVWNLDGGQGGTAAGTGAEAGRGGHGGSLTVAAGSLLVQGGAVSVAGGVGGTGAPDAANGGVTVTGGTLTLDTGTVRGRGGVASADPLTIAQASLTVSGPGQVDVLNDLTVGPGGSFSVSDGAVDATPAPAPNDVAGDAGRQLSSTGALSFTGGTIRYDGGDGGGTFAPFTTAGAGGGGGELVATGGSVAIGGTADVSFDGGTGGSVLFDAAGGTGGRGGELAVGVNATISGSAVVSLSGGAGGNGDTDLAGVGGRGGIIEVNAGGSVVQSGSSQVLLHGGPGGSGSDASGGNGGVGGEVVTNGGTYTIQDAAVLSLRGGAAGSGNAGADGQIQVFTADFIMNGGTVHAGTISETVGDFDFNGGTLSVAQFNGTLDQDGGILAPGDSPGVTNIVGDYNFNSGAIEIELFGDGGVAGTDHDQVNVTGTVALAGELVVEVDNGYTPLSTDSFTVLTAGALSGVFANLGDGDRVVASGRQGSFLVSYSAASNEVVLSNYLDGSFLAGDYNVDGVVDGNDFLIWQRGGSPDPLSPLDLAAWQANYGAASSLASARGVPEPSALILGVLGFAGALSLRRRPDLNSLV